MFGRHFNSSDLLKNSTSGLHVEKDVSLRIFGVIPSGIGVLVTFEFLNHSNTSCSVIYSPWYLERGQAHVQVKFYPIDTRDI